MQLRQSGGAPGRVRAGYMAPERGMFKQEGADAIVPLIAGEGRTGDDPGVARGVGFGKRHPGGPWAAL